MTQYISKLLADSIPSFLSAFSALEQKIAPDLPSLTENNWRHLREPLNKLVHLQQEAVRQLEGRWFLRSSYLVLIAEANELAESAHNMAESIRDNYAASLLINPEFDALTNHALAISKKFLEQPESLFKPSTQTAPVFIEVDKAI